jgi:hypothetical protein
MVNNSESDVCENIDISEGDTKSAHRKTGREKNHHVYKFQSHVPK